MNHSSDYKDILDVKNYRNICVKKNLPLKNRDILLSWSHYFEILKEDND